MTVHLIRSEEFSSVDFDEVIFFLQSYDGPIRFVSTDTSPAFTNSELQDRDMDIERFFKQERVCYSMASFGRSIPERRKEVGWKDLFARCRNYRKTHKVPPTDLVILLTEIANKHNWFSALDPSNSCNGFVHTSEWDYYVQCSRVFPIAYLTISLVLQKHMFRDMKSLQELVHHFPLGCINDFCGHKREIMLKLRTADVCQDCMSLIGDKLPPLAVQQALNIFEAVRLRILFNQNFRQNMQVSRLEVTPQNRILLLDYGNMEIRLTPLEKTLYLFFLNHPEGIMLHDLVDHTEELRAIYSRISTSGLLAEIYSRIGSLVNVNTNSASEKISKIKAAFVKALGTDLAKHYYIQGEINAPKRILLRRDLCVVKNE
jgi:hypothetical protein